MLPWRTVPLALTLFLSCLCPQGTAGENVKCWWHAVTADSHSVSVMCRADSHGSVLKCGLCYLRLDVNEASPRIVSNHCSRMSASFNMSVEEQVMQNLSCTLQCPGHTTPNCIVQKGYPPPTCLIPADDIKRNIHCHWAASQSPSNPTVFTLHWVHDYRPDGAELAVGENQHGIIPRADYVAHSYIKVWVSAASALYSVDSESFKTSNMETIIQPTSPCVTNHTSDPLEIFWEVREEAGLTGEWQCEVQYRMQCEETWTEVEDLFQVSFSLEDTIPFSTYTFRVRCWIHLIDESGVMSEWSEEYSATTPAAAPVGKLDVWSDCNVHSGFDFNCTILWKEFPKHQARGIVCCYVVRAKLWNGSDLILGGVMMNKSTEMCTQYDMQTADDEPVSALSSANSHLRCPQEQDQRCFRYSLLGVPFGEVNCIHVIAHTARGPSLPARVALTRNGLQQSHYALEVKLEEHELNVSWSVPSRFSDDLQEFVVQHKRIGLFHTSCSNWVTVPNKQKSVIIRGRFSNYTAYNISLFAVANNSRFLLQSVISYTVEGVPPKVTDLSVQKHTSSSTVNLTWVPIPLTEGRGHILNYIVGLTNHSKEYIVAGNKSSFRLFEVEPCQQYEVWIRAATAAGRGETASIRFINCDYESSKLIFILLIVIPLFLSLFGFRFLIRRTVLRIIPDPINSTSFKEMSNQFWHSWPGPSPSMEHGLAISHVEIITRSQSEHDDDVEQPVQPEQNVDLEEEDKDQETSGGLQRTDFMPPRTRKEYSQVIDTSDEDEYDESFEQPYSSDYEKHFMPCVVDT